MRCMANAVATIPKLTDKTFSMKMGLRRVNGLESAKRRIRSGTSIDQNTVAISRRPNDMGKPLDYWGDGWVGICGGAYMVHSLLIVARVLLYSVLVEHHRCNPGDKNL